MPFDRADEPVTPPRQRFDILWCFRGIAQRFPQLVHRCVQPVVEVHKRVAGPKHGAKLLARHEFARLPQQDGKNFEWLADQLDLYSELPDFVRVQVGLEWTELHSFCAASVHRV